jgi:2-oxoisovalerate dehydrogenase E1 component
VKKTKANSKTTRDKKTIRKVKLVRRGDETGQGPSKLELVEQLGLTKQDLKEIYYNVYTSRKLDDAEISMKKQSKAFFQISGAGHEGILTAISRCFRPKHDYFLCYYRDRALCLGLGVTPYEMLCQANGNTGDTASHGRQMPAHWGNKDLNIVSKSSCTGTQFLQAVGLAEGGRYLDQIKDQEQPRNEDEMVFVSCGDGTTSQGEFWEALTTATVNKLPVMFLVEDNGYAISVPVAVQTPGGSISKALAQFPNLKIFTCDGNCPIESLNTVKQATEYLQSGQGPVLLHAFVTRPYSHSLSDDHSFYRTEQELADEKEQDVIVSFREWLIEEQFFTEQEIKGFESEISESVLNDMKKAIETEWPKKSTYADHMYSMTVDPSSDQFNTEAVIDDPQDIPMAQGINRTLKAELKRNPLIRMFGEDVADFSELEKFSNEELAGKGGVFKVTSGCQRQALEDGRVNQVFNSPLAEANIVGRAIGMAVRGIKPVVEIQFFDYIWTAYMQLKNEMATMRYRSGGDYSCPMVVRVPIGGYLRGGSIYHSQSGESFFTHIPGVRVIIPSNTTDAVGLLRTAIRCEDPVMFLEHKHLYYQGYNRAPYPGDDFMIPFGKANIIKTGTDATILTWGALVQRSIEAVKQIEQELGVSIEVIDARTLAPFDWETLTTSVEKTNRLLVVHEETKTSGFAGEIMAEVNNRCFEYLDAPPKRVTAKDTYVAYCPDLEEVILPQVSDIKETLTELVRY